MSKIILLLFFIFSCTFNFLVKFQIGRMHSLYSKLVLDRILNEEKSYPSFVSVMDSLNTITLVFSILILIMSLIFFFDKECSKIIRISILAVSILGLLPQLVVY